MFSFLPLVDFLAHCESYFEGNGNFSSRRPSLLSLNGNWMVLMKVMIFSVWRCFKSLLGILIEEVRMVYLVAFKLELSVVFWKTFTVQVVTKSVATFGGQIYRRFLPLVPGRTSRDHLCTARLLLVASLGRPLYSLVGLLRNADDEDDDEDG